MKRKKLFSTLAALSLTLPLTLLLSPATSQAEAIPVTPATKIFSADSFWYQQLPDTVPLDSSSSSKITAIYNEGVKAYGDVNRNIPSMTINTEKYSPPIYIASNSDPVVTFV